MRTFTLLAVIASYAAAIHDDAGLEPISADAGAELAGDIIADAANAGAEAVAVGEEITNEADTAAADQATVDLIDNTMLKSGAEDP